jgi:hypothetical protein
MLFGVYEGEGEMRDAFAHEERFRYVDMYYIMYSLLLHLFACSSMRCFSSVSWKFLPHTSNRT